MKLVRFFSIVAAACQMPAPGSDLLGQIISLGRDVGSYAEPTSETCSSVTYEIPDRTLTPGQSLHFAVPQRLRNRAVQFVVLGHRQDYATNTGSTAEGYDERPGLTSVQIYSDRLPMDRAWRYWGGDASGNKGAKFAEVRGYPELENLYEWRRYGHRSVADDSSSTDPLYPSQVRLESRGADPVTISLLTLKVEPPRANAYIQGIFSPGTRFDDPDTGRGHQFGGGQDHQGRFPGAVVLGHSANPDAKLPAGWSQEQNTLLIPTTPGRRITAVEVACGDSHPDGIENQDGGIGTPGWARLSVALRRADGTIIPFLSGENVPPEGILFASPPTCDLTTQPGDQIIVTGQSDNVYVMGVRVGTQGAE